MVAVLQMTCSLKRGMVANDLCIKAKNRCGSVKQSSFQWFGVFRAIRHFYTSNRGFAVTIFFRFIMIDDTTVKLLSLKRQKIGMIHINCFQPKHMLWVLENRLKRLFF